MVVRFGSNPSSTIKFAGAHEHPNTRKAFCLFSAATQS